MEIILNRWRLFSTYLTEYVNKEQRNMFLNFNKIDDRKYYVYRITHIKEGVHYYGSRITKKDVYTDLLKYCSSSSRKEHIKNNKNEYKFKIIRVFDNAGMMISYESFLHQFFDVKTHTKFFNRANQLPHAFSTAGTRMRETTKEKLRQVNLGRKNTPESIEKTRQANLGVPLTEEHRNKIAVANTGKKHSEESRKKMSDSAKNREPSFKGHKHSEETKEKIRKANTGRNITDEHKAILRDKALGRKQPLIECPYCGKVGGNMMRVWHFDNCKYKEEDNV